jgi:hypothetical protein
MTTKLHKEAVAAVEAWCKKRKWKLISKPRHVHPQSYVVGYAAPKCLVVSKCWADSEPHMKDWNKEYPLETINEFDNSLRAGDWCVVAYVCTQAFQQSVAIPITAKLRSKNEHRG